jgi:hypothetical protein
LSVFALSKILPASPASAMAPLVATDIVPPSDIVNVGTGANDGADTVIFPASPVFDAVLNNPLPEPEIFAEFAAVKIKSPPFPPLVVLLSTLAPLDCEKSVTFKATLPALPAPEVATEIVPPLFIVNVGVFTLISPAFPVLDAVLNKPVGPLPVPEIVADLAALTITLPPLPAPSVLLTTCAPPVRLKLFASSKTLPALPSPEVATEILPLSASVNVGTAVFPGAETVI